MDKPEFDMMPRAGNAETAAEEAIAPRLGFWQRLRGYFLAGIVVAAPITITIYLTFVFLTFIDTSVNAILPEEFYKRVYGGATVPGIGIVVAIVFFVFIGWFATNFLGRLFIGVSEYLVNRMPVIRALYNATKQVFETVMASKSQAFREPVLVEFPRKGAWTIAFVTGQTEGELRRVLADTDMINIYVPTAPNPTSGYMLFVPRKDLIYLEMSVEEAIKMVVSTGIITPPDPQDPETLAKKTVKPNLVIPKRPKKSDV